MGVTIPEESTRDRLLDAAETLFSDRGFEGVGIREIAETAGVNLSGIKYHFGSKRGLYMETIYRAMDRQGTTEAWTTLDVEINSREEAAEVFRGFIGALLGVMLRPDEASPCLCLVMQSAVEAGEAADVVVREFIGPKHERLSNFVQKLRPEATGAECSRAAQSVMAMLLHQRLFRAFIERIEECRGENGVAGDARVAQMADEITAFVLRGMGCDDLVRRACPGLGVE